MGRPRIGSEIMRSAASLVAIVCALAAGPAAAQTALRCLDAPAPAPAWCDIGLSADARAAALLGAMTRAQKLSLMAGDEPLGALTGDPATGWCHGIAALFVPDVYYNDGPSGLRLRPGGATGLPSPMALASSFDPAVADLAGDLLADEATKRRVDVVLAPMVNIVRYPASGRAFESYGEDPHLAARLAVAVVTAIQRERLLPSGHVARIVADPKHFVANNHEINRFTVSAEVDDRTLREIYLPAFEAAVREAGAGTVMLAYNRVNGIPMTEHGPLVNGLLKGEWGFAGIALTDWALAQRSTIGAANNGTDLEMPMQFWYTPLLLDLAVTGGLVSMATIDDHVGRILRTMFAFGMLDRPELPLAGDVSANAAAARALAADGAVLLKNEPAAGDGAPILPLDDGALAALALIGSAATTYIRGGGSSAVDPVDPVTPCEGIGARAASAGIAVVCDDGSDRARARDAAAAADVAVVFASLAATEFLDRTCLGLSCQLGDPDQDGLIADVAAANPRTVVVLETASAVLMPWEPAMPAILEAWYPGQEGGHALADVLFGDAEPGGRLPVTFPLREEDTPFFGHPERWPGVAEMAEYSEGIFVGYRWYDEHGLDVLFPFGHGLGYTSFEYSDLAIDLGGPDPVVRVAVTNTGGRRGAEVVQLYVGLPATAVAQPPRALKGFQKIVLDPGARATVAFTLDERALSYWDVASASWQVAAGCYRVMVGASSRDLRVAGSFGRGGGPGCATCPTAGCRAAVASGKSRLLIKDTTPDQGDRLVWTLAKGPATAAADLGNPLAATGYALCLVDGGGAVLLEAAAPAGGTCGGKPCWKPTRKGFRYADRDLTPDGIQKIELKAGDEGRAKIVVKGKSASLALGFLPIQTLPVTAQLAGSDGQCWEATFAATRRNHDGQLKAVSD